MAGRVGTGAQQKFIEVPDKETHGSDFRLMLDSLRAGMSFTELDDRARAHCIGLLQGLALARTGKLEGWDLESSFLSLDL